VPIRFRCAYCNQLMGIARRKAGTVVRCPTCSGQVVVPGPEADVPGPGEQGAAGPNVFERSDFDEMLRPNGPAAHAGTVAAGAQAAPPPGAWGTHAEPMPQMERVDEVAVAAPAPMSPLTPLPAGGVLLSTRQMTMLAIAAALMLGLVFAAGVLVGKFVL